MPDDTPTDHQLMLAVRAGDMDSFELLVLRHQEIAWKTAYRFIGDAVEAEDLAQEAFLKILAAADRYKPSANFKTYLLQVLTRLCIDRSRKKRPVLPTVLPEKPDSGEPPDEVSLIQERNAVIRAALDSLPANQRMAIILRYFEDMSGAQIAAAIGVSTKAVERLLSRARETLKTSLKDFSM